MKLPPGFQSTNPTLVCLLKKTLYGLRLELHYWFSKLSSALKKYGFKQSYADYSLFTLVSCALILYVLIYVDDIIVTGNNSEAIARFKIHLPSYFHMNDLGS